MQNSFSKDGYLPSIYIEIALTLLVFNKFIQAFGRTFLTISPVLTYSTLFVAWAFSVISKQETLSLPCELLNKLVQLWNLKDFQHLCCNKEIINIAWGGEIGCTRKLFQRVGAELIFIYNKIYLFIIYIHNIHFYTHISYNRDVHITETLHQYTLIV